MNFINRYFEEMEKIIKNINRSNIRKMVDILQQIRNDRGRLFIIGVGGGAGHASHAVNVNDFRKICEIESYTPTDNVSELTARINDDSWETSYVNWLSGSNLRDRDALLIFSVGGGSYEKNISVNIVKSIEYAKEVNAKVLGIVGKNGGYTAAVADACVVIPVVNESTITPHTEAFQAVVWHLLVSHPDLQKYEMKWESTK